MNRKEHCSACNMIRNGVKSRIALEHTCGLEPGAMPPPDWEMKSITVSVFTDYQLGQLSDLIKNAIVEKVGFVRETKALFVEYRGYKHEYDAVMKTRSIPRQKPN